MDENQNLLMPIPVVDQKEELSLNTLTERYNKFITPSTPVKIGKKAGELIPNKVKAIGNGLTATISAQDLYKQAMELVVSGFKIVEEQAARFSISDKNIIEKINSEVSDYQITNLNEICFVRSYKTSKLVNKYKSQDILTAFVEGAATGVFGFLGLPFNIVLSTFLYFRAVQSIAMFYGYDVKNDNAELVIASEVFTSSLSPLNDDINNEVGSIIGKVMLLSQAAVVKETAKKAWTDMALRGGVPLLLTQMRALAHKSARKALEKAGAKGLERSVFKEAFEQIGRKVTLKTIQKSAPAFSAVFSALIDTAQMKKVLEYADIFYQKRYILEKERRINEVLETLNSTIDPSIMDN